MVLAESERQLTGHVEVDDAYLGGERSGGKVGRGSENNVPFVVAVLITWDARAHLARLSARPFSNETSKDSIVSSMALPLTVVPDDQGCFTVTDREVTGSNTSLLNDKLRTVNTIISNFKLPAAALIRHQVRRVRHRYATEVQFRFILRYDMRAMLGACYLRAPSIRSSPRAVLGWRRFIGSQAHVARSALRNI